MDDLNKQWEQTSKVNLVTKTPSTNINFLIGERPYGVEESDATGDNRARADNPAADPIGAAPKNPDGSLTRGS